MPNTIKHKTSVLSGKKPEVSELIVGELALNAGDGILYAKMADDSIRQVQFVSPIIDYGMTSETASQFEDFGFIAEQPEHGIDYGGIG